MKRGDEITVTLEAFASEGKSLVRVDGVVLFVTGAVPGDTVRVRLTKLKKSFWEGTAREVITPSPLRATPRCRYFGTCGGCTWQNVRYEAQLEFKRQHVVDALERIGGFRGIVVNPALGSEDPYFYRNKMEFSFGARWLTPEEFQLTAGHRETLLPALGLHIPGRFDRVLDLEECWLQSELSGAIVNRVRRFAFEKDLTVFSTRTHQGYLRNLMIRQSRHTGEVMVNLVTRDDRPDIMQALTEILRSEFPAVTTICNNITERKSQVAIGDREVVYFGPGFVTERMGGRVYRISANSFFQTNTHQAERLYDTVRRLAGFRRDDVVYDLYSGTGTIGLHIADDVRTVVGVESIAAAVEDARLNAKANGVTNCTFVQGDLRETLMAKSSLPAMYGAPDVILIDPPRAGMHDDVVERVLALSPRSIVYVSCNPATQARDLVKLCATYRIGEVQPVDMFPQTFHIENVVALFR